jgi:hypothetical protein
MRNSAHRLMKLACLGVCATWLLAGCSSDSTASEATPGVGRVELALTGTSTSGRAYRLRDGVIDIIGTSTTSFTTESYLDANVISIELPAGGYLATLNDGWRLEGDNGDGTWQDVPAILTSTNPLPFAVYDQQTTDAALTFRAGNEVVAMGNGRVHFTVQVDDTMGAAGMGGGGGNCAAACMLASGLACGNDGICVEVCSDLGQLLIDSQFPTPCRAEGDAYSACASGSDGSDYVCSPVAQVPISQGCAPLFDAALNCTGCPAGLTWDGMQCVVCTDNDGDGTCQETGDCDDSNPGVPTMETCGNGVDDDCNGIVDDNCVSGWTCDPQYFNDGSCDCGCGVFDPDCTDGSSAACAYCDDQGSCSAGIQGCPGIINPTDNTNCN